MAGDLEEKNTPSPELTVGLTKKDKLKFSGLVFLALLIIVVGFWQLRRGIKGPFEVYLSQAQEAQEQQNQAATSLDLLTAAELRVKDTDKDGLNDYEELNIYRTSPYVADTDSDGYDDKTEVVSGNDPNCPQGKSCTGAEITASPATGTTAPVNPAIEELMQGLTSGNIDPKTLRELLVQQGIDKQMLDKLTDAELLKAFGNAVEKTSTASLSVGSSPAAAATIEDLENISAADLRTLLKQQGVSEADLSKIKDADLLAAFKEVLKQ